MGGEAGLSPDLSLISPSLRARGAEAFEAGDALGFLCKAQGGNTEWLWIVRRNVGPLKGRGIYEVALLLALTATRTNNLGVPPRVLRRLIEQADRGRLREAGAPLPRPGPFTLFRGVAGRGRARRVRGLSWTEEPDLAAWFACRFSVESPAVFRGVFEAPAVLAYTTDRDEEEYLVDVPRDARLVRPFTEKDIRARADIVNIQRREQRFREVAQRRKGGRDAR